MVFLTQGPKFHKILVNWQRLRLYLLVVEFCSESLGKDFQHLTTRFNRIRVKRYGFIYDLDRPIPRTEAAKSLESAEIFVEEDDGKGTDHCLHAEADCANYQIMR